jgi:transcriptional regulator with XRE-family HTH domain
VTQAVLSDTITKLKQIWKRFADKHYRDAFVRSHIVSGVAAQVFSLREQAGLTQEELAKKSGMKQTRISLIESGEIENIQTDTLARIASALDVALVVKFAPFSELAEWASTVNETSLSPVSFAFDSIATSSVAVSEAMHHAIRDLSVRISMMNKNLEATGKIDTWDNSIFLQNASGRASVIEAGMELLRHSTYVPPGVRAGYVGSNAWADQPIRSEKFLVVGAHS